MVTGPRREAVVSENKRYECVWCEGRNGRPGFPATTVPAGTDFVTTVLTSRYPRGRRAGEHLPAQRLRPVRPGSHEALLENVRIVGSLLAGQRYLRERCGDGVALTSGWRAAASLRPTQPAALVGPAAGRHEGGHR